LVKVATGGRWQVRGWELSDGGDGGGRQADGVGVAGGEPLGKGNK